MNPETVYKLAFLAAWRWMRRDYRQDIENGRKFDGTFSPEWIADAQVIRDGLALAKSQKTGSPA